MAAPTPSQTVGPFFEIGLRWLESPELVPASHPRSVRIEGHIFDGSGAPVPDALVEVYQADEEGRFPPESRGDWTGFGRTLSDLEGRFHFVTVKPGALDDGSAPHLDVSVFARGLLERLVTRCYFDDEDANAVDPVLTEIGAAAAATLVAAFDAGVYRFDVHLQGPKETAFFVW